MLSDLIDDQYWNFAYLTNKNIDIKDTWEQIKNDMNANVLIQLPDDMKKVRTYILLAAFLYR